MAESVNGTVPYLFNVWTDVLAAEPYIVGLTYDFPILSIPRFERLIPDVGSYWYFSALRKDYPMLPEDARTVTELCDALCEGAKPAYLYFWRHYKRKDGVIGPSCLSQWWEESYCFEGVEYHTAEHFMMAEKARLFGDEEMLTKILAAKHPKTAKAYGRKVSGFNDRAWKQNRFDIVVRGNIAKFRESPSLREYLLNTENAVLVEASPYDRIWGIGLAESSPQAQNPNMWKGTNLLGFALMEARAQLRTND